MRIGALFEILTAGFSILGALFVFLLLFSGIGEKGHLVVAVRVKDKRDIENLDIALSEAKMLSWRLPVCVLNESGEKLIIDDNAIEIIEKQKL